MEDNIQVFDFHSLKKVFTEEVIVSDNETIYYIHIAQEDSCTVTMSSVSFIKKKNNMYEITISLHGFDKEIMQFKLEHRISKKVTGQLALSKYKYVLTHIAYSINTF